VGHKIRVGPESGNLLQQRDLAISLSFILSVLSKADITRQHFIYREAVNSILDSSQFRYIYKMELKEIYLRRKRTEDVFEFE
jgi:hypothetical protein